MPRFIISPPAQADLVGIWRFIAEDSEAHADAFIDAVKDKFHILAQNPQMGRVRDELAGCLRSFVFGRYVIFYMPLEDGVDIIRVLHGARDLVTIFHTDE